MISHRSLVNHAVAISKRYELSSSDRVLQFANFSFDVAAEEIFPTLLSGAAVVILPLATQSSIARFSGFLAERSVSVVNLPVSYWREWTAFTSGKNDAMPGTVRLVVTGSERVYAEDYNSWRRVAGRNVRWLNAYGLTETTITSMVFEPSDREEELSLVPIGKPIENTHVYVLDKNLQPVPWGVPGELYIGGDCVGIGYLNRPELTAERFVSNHLNGTAASVLYRTGDRVRTLPDGNIEFLDRVDNQVKIRGFRVELGEIEGAIDSFKYVSANVVRPFVDPSGGIGLVAYFVSTLSSGIDSVELRRHLRARLPEHMIPADYVQLEKLPLTHNGKVDREQLPIPVRDRSAIEEDHESPRDETEAKLVAIWSELLSVEDIGIHDNFFDLGGHSLLAVRMFARVEETFRKNIPIATLFESGTISKLAEILNQDDWHEPETSIVPIQPNGTKPPLFCIHAGGGNVLFYRDLAKHLGTDQPLFGIQARRVGGRQVAHETVEEMATFYISELRSIQPKGPFFIGGSSFGGLVALEMAQQLRDQGEVVALLALMDTGSPTYPQLLAGTTPLKAKIYESARRIQHHFDSLLGLNSEHRLPYILQKLAKLKLRYGRKKRHLFRRAAQSYNARFNADKDLSAEYIQLEDQIEKSLERYKVRSFSGKITLFRALNQPLGIVPDPTLGWDGIPSELEIHDVPGHHGSVVAEPYVGVLAEKLAVCIDRAADKQKLNGNGPTDQERNGATAILPKSLKVAANSGKGGAFGILLIFACCIELVCVELLAVSVSLGLPII